MSEVLKNEAEIVANIVSLVSKAREKAAIYVNTETTLLYYAIGNYLNTAVLGHIRAEYDKQILATVSQELTKELGKGYSYSALTRMCKVAQCYEQEKIATLSQQLSWSHFIELASLADTLKIDFYTQLVLHGKWSVRQLRKEIDTQFFERSALAAQPEEVIKKELALLNTSERLNPDLVFKNTYVLDFMNLPQYHSEKELENALVAHIEAFILELGSGFTFVERQKRISVDAIDYHLDLLFYHRKLRRLIAVDLKLGKFKPHHKAQMELYLRWLEKNDMQSGEEKPIGLLLCSEGNTEHVELLMLDEKDIKVAQYLTELPSKKWFEDKLHRAMAIASMNKKSNENA